MMGSSRTNEKGKAPVSENPLFEANHDYARNISPNTHQRHGMTFLEENVDDDDFDSLLDMPFSIADWEEIHQSLTQGIPETIENPRVYSTNPNSFQNPQKNLSSNAVNTNHQEVPLLADLNMGWGQQCMNQGKNAISAGGISTFGGESSFESFNRPQVNRDIIDSPFLFRSKDTATVHTRNNVNFNTNQSGIHGNFKGSFLSLGIGGTQEAITRSQSDNKEISDKLKEAASAELKIARAQKAAGQTLGAGFMGFQNNDNGFSNQFSPLNRMTSTNNEVGFHGTLNSGLGSSRHHILQMQQNNMQHGWNVRSGDLDHFRAEKLKEADSTEIKMAQAQKAISQTSGQTLGTGFMGFQNNNSGFSNQFSNVDRMTSTNIEVGVHTTTLNSGLDSSPNHILQMQQNDIRNIRSGSLDHYRLFIGNQSVNSGTLVGNSSQLFNSQQHNLNKPPEFEKPTWLASYYTPSEQLKYPSTTANSPNYPGQVISQNATSTQVVGGNLFSQRTVAAPQVSWVGSGPAGIDAPFPKRLGVEFNVRNSPQISHRHFSPMGTSLLTTSTGQMCQFQDKGSTHLPGHVVRPSIGRTDGGHVTYPMKSQQPFFAHGQSQNAMIQRPKDPQVALSTNASTVVGQPEKSDFHVRPHHKRTAVVTHPASHWVQRQKIIHPTVHYSSMPKPPIPVTTTGLIHPSIPVGLQTRPAGPVTGPVAARICPAVPCASNVRPRVPVTTAPAVYRITRKDPEATPKLSGYKCFLCKRDLALTSDGPVYQPTVPPPVAILPCGHTFHDQCLQNITPQDQAKDPPCIPCAIGEN